MILLFNWVIFWGSMLVVRGVISMHSNHNLETFPPPPHFAEVTWTQKLSTRSILFKENFHIHNYFPNTLPETNIAPENRWLEY